MKHSRRMTRFPKSFTSRASIPRGSISCGFTLIELLVVLGILSLLAALLLPVFAGIREKGRRVTCQSNLHQIDLALTAYTQDNQGFFPPALTPKGDWAGTILSYASSNAVFRCPDCSVPSLWEGDLSGLHTDTAKGYALNSSLYDATLKDNPALPEGRVEFPASTVAVCEFAYRAGSLPNETSYPSALLGPDDGTELAAGEQFFGAAGAERHQGGSNYVFVDGHVHWCSPPQVLRSKQGNDGTSPAFAL